MKLLIIIFFKIVFAICWIILAYGLVDRVICLYKMLSKKEEPVSFSEQFFTNTELQPKRFDREAELLKIMEDADRNREKHQIVLWLGLDGLRLNDDGTTEWISRRREVPGLGGERDKTDTYCWSDLIADETGQSKVIRDLLYDREPQVLETTTLGATRQTFIIGYPDFDCTMRDINGKLIRLPHCGVIRDMSDSFYTLEGNSQN